jgi:two-component system cell cycle sensor histidine kinase/response regulator CckA
MTAAPVSRKQTILVVDDEEIVRSLTTRMLEAHGYTVIEAGNGFDAWTLLENEGEHIDLVISDVMMPRLDGLELAGCMGIMPHPPPLLLMSGWGLSTLKLERPFLVKPFHEHELLAAVHHLLKPPSQGDLESSDAAPS